MSVLEVRNLSFGYKKDAPLFTDLSLSIKSDERVGVIAPSGFGKTTLCELLAGYLEPASGSVLIDGKAISRQSGSACPVQLIWQHPEQAMDPYMRIERSLHEAGAIPAGIMEGLGIADAWLSRYPHELSGGELQRCCIARTLATSPKFLICDETTTMLDAVTQAQIWEFLLLHCAQGGIGMLIVTHSPALMKRLATRVIDLTRTQR